MSEEAVESPRGRAAPEGLARSARDSDAGHGAGHGQAAAVSGTNGKQIFLTKCGGCHTLKTAGTTGTTGPNLDLLKPPFPIVKKQVINGGAIMPAFKGVLTNAQIDAVAKYVAAHAGK